MTEEQLKKAVNEAMEENLKQFYVERETHYQQHEFIGKIMSFYESIGNTALQTIVRSFIGAFFVLLVLGFVFWAKLKTQ